MRQKLDRDKKCAEVLRHLQNQLQELTSTCQGLGWSIDDVLQSSDSVTCPLSRGHRMPPPKLTDHLERCELRHRGLSHEEINELPPSSLPFYTRAPAVRSLVLTREMQAQLLSQELAQPSAINVKAVPPSADRAVMELSVSERRALYDGVVHMLGEEGDGSQKASEFTLLHQLHQLEEQLKTLEEKPTEAEAMQASAQAERDQHRRRRSYRGVHTDRRSHHEVLRDVIERQMALLREVWSARERTRRRGAESGGARRKVEAEDSEPRKRWRRRSISESDSGPSSKQAKKSAKKKKKEKKAKKGKKHKKKSPKPSSSPK